MAQPEKNKQVEFNFIALWKARRRILKTGLYTALFSFAIFMILPWKTNYEALIRIQPELTTTGESTTIEAEIDIIQAWSTLTNAVQKMQRTVVVESRHSMWFMHIVYYVDYLLSSLSGSYIAPFADYQPSIQLQNFTIIGPKDTMEHIGERFVLTVGEKNTYSLFHENGGTILNGVVGITSKAPLDKDGKYKLQILVSKISASNGERFNITTVDENEFVKNLQQDLKISRKGFREQSGLMRVNYSSCDPATARQLLQAVVNNYLSQAYDRSSLGKINGLTKLDAKAEELRQQVADADWALANFKQDNDIVDISQDQDFDYKRSLEINQELAKINLEYKAASVALTDKHPSVVELLNKRSYLQQELDQINGRQSDMPRAQQQYNELQRNVTIAQSMLDQNTALAAQLRAQVETITGYANLVSFHNDEDFSPFTRGLLVLLFGFLAGSAITLSYMIYILSPQKLSIYMADYSGTPALPVVAKLPVKCKKISLLWNDRYPSTVQTDYDWERRTIGEMEYLEQKSDYLLPAKANKILFFTNIGNIRAAGVCAREFAISSAKKHKTLLIDANIMNPGAHISFGGYSHPGLAEAFVGNEDVTKIIKTTKTKNLSILPAGEQTSNFNLLANADNLKSVLAKLAPLYDRIIVEFPTLTPNICSEGALKNAHALFICTDYDMPVTKLYTALKECNVADVKASFLILSKDGICW